MLDRKEVIHFIGAYCGVTAGQIASFMLPTEIIQILSYRNHTLPVCYPQVLDSLCTKKNIPGSNVILVPLNKIGMTISTSRVN